MAVVETDKTKKRAFTDGTLTIEVTINTEAKTVTMRGQNAEELPDTEIEEVDFVRFANCIAQAAIWVNSEFNPI